MTRLDKIEQRLAKCSPWPWTETDDYVFEKGGLVIANTFRGGNPSNAQLIANAPADIAALLKVARAAEAHIKLNFATPQFAAGGLQFALNELNESEG